MTLFVRSQDNLAILRDPNANGRVLTEFEVSSAFGEAVLNRVLDEGVVALPPSVDEPSSTIKRRRESLGLSVHDVAKSASVNDVDIERAEDASKVSSIRSLEKIAIALGLDERVISFSKGAGGDDELAGRLKAISGQASLNAAAVSALSEASWVIRAQHRLMGVTDRAKCPLMKFEPSNNYGSAGYPAYEHGYYLAQETRRILGLSKDEPIASLRGLCENEGIVVVQSELPRSVAGATVAVESNRGIVLNICGFNENVWVRRATLAHELAHLFWDPEERLQHITVDDYARLETLAVKNVDHVEARANAFAIAFLAPPRATEEIFLQGGRPEDGLRHVMEHFGVSFSAAKHHVENCLGRPIDVGRLECSPSLDWTARENFTVDYFPEPNTPISRRGQFVAEVIAALDRHLISDDTASTYLNIPNELLGERLKTLRQLYL